MTAQPHRNPVIQCTSELDACGDAKSPRAEFATAFVADFAMAFAPLPVNQRRAALDMIRRDLRRFHGAALWRMGGSLQINMPTNHRRIVLREFVGLTDSQIERIAAGKDQDAYAVGRALVDHWMKITNFNAEYAPRKAWLRCLTSSFARGDKKR